MSDAIEFNEWVRKTYSCNDISASALTTQNAVRIKILSPKSDKVLKAIDNWWNEKSYELQSTTTSDIPGQYVTSKDWIKTTLMDEPTQDSTVPPSTEISSVSRGQPKHFTPPTKTFLIGIVFIIVIALALYRSPLQTTANPGMFLVDLWRNLTTTPINTTMVKETSL